MKIKETTFTKEEYKKAKLNVMHGLPVCSNIACSYVPCGICPLNELLNDDALTYIKSHLEEANQ